MEIPRKYIDNYTKALNKLSADVQEKLGDDLAKIDFAADVATVRDAVIDRMEFYLAPYTDMAAILAAEFYDGLRELEVGEALGAYTESGREAIATEKAVRGIMQDVVEGKAADAVIGKLVSRADYEIKRAAGECMYRNGKRDPLKPKFARVPSGKETCRFCIMLASRGFVYHNEKTAGENGHYHANCDCRIVPGFTGKTTVPGYDPDKLYDQWKHPEKYSAASSYPSAVATKEEAIALAKTSKSRVFCVKGDHLIENARNVKLTENNYRVVMHGKPNACYLYGHEVTAKEFANVIKAREDYSGEDIDLISCSLGDDRKGVPFAKELADEMGVKTTAATRMLWTWGTSEYKISDKMFGSSGRGKFKEFKPNDEQPRLHHRP